MAISQTAGSEDIRSGDFDCKTGTTNQPLSTNDQRWTDVARDIAAMEMTWPPEHSQTLLDVANIGRALLMIKARSDNGSGVPRVRGKA